ncbi:hypothetical protein Ciccas_006595 [Cichlidogyrus casuarinus]|uniref:Uncharacterized protein n=1 Tax=Cichlidogyrus casuarinus TaxID=1844966 RepID=A0ABD2Q5D9_9PLAT
MHNALHSKTQHIDGGFCLALSNLLITYWDDHFSSQRNMKIAIQIMPCTASPQGLLNPSNRAG